MACTQIKLEGPDSPPIIYPKLPVQSKVITPVDYKVVNFNYLFDYAKSNGKHRDRVPLWKPMKESKHIDPFSGKKYKPLPPILFDFAGQPAGWGVPVGDILGHGSAVMQSLVGHSDMVLDGYRQHEVTVVVQV